MMETLSTPMSGCNLLMDLLFPSASDFQFPSAGDRWFRACGAKLELYYLIVSFYPNFYLFFIAFMMLLRATSGFIASSSGISSGVT